MLRALLAHRPHQLSLLLLAVFSLICTRIPLFNYLGFEFSALTAVVASFFAGLLTVSSWEAQLGSGDDVPGTESSEERLWQALKQMLTTASLLSMVPLSIMSANALVVKNCSLAEGFLFFALLVIPSVLFASTLALLLVVLTPRWRRTWFVVVFVLLLLHVAVVTFTRPQIFAFNPIVGYFPGITYDEILRVDARLVLYRWATIAASVLFFILAVILYRWRRLRRLHTVSSGRRAAHPVEVAAGAVLGIIVVGVFAFSSSLGLATTAESLENTLGGRYETNHFVIVYPADEVSPERIGRLAELHEYFFVGLASELRVVPLRKIHSFLYSSAEQKGRLVGAGRTNIAKPWLWQLHLNLADIETSLKHELVHVLAAEFGFPLLRVGLNAGLIEGLASAMERVSYEEPLHRIAGHIFSIGVEPDLASLFTIRGFAKAHPAVSYTLAGSFCRYLIDRYGMRRFKMLYRTGNFRRHYNRDLIVLLAEWRRFVERVEVSEEERQRAMYLFKRPSIFAKECARVIAAANERTRALMANRDYEAALVTSGESLKLSRSVEAIQQHATCLLRLGRYEAAVEFANKALADSSVAHALVPLNLVLGDAALAMGNDDEARRRYGDLLNIHLSTAWDEACAVRLEMLATEPAASSLRPYVVANLSDTLRLELVAAFHRAHPTVAVGAYLLGRELIAQQRPDSALSVLLSMNRLRSEELEFLRQQRIARLYFDAGSFQRASIYFWQSLNFARGEAQVYSTRDWLKRCEWMEGRRDALPELRDEIDGTSALLESARPGL